MRFTESLKIYDVFTTENILKNYVTLRI